MRRVRLDTILLTAAAFIGSLGCSDAGPEEPTPYEQLEPASLAIAPIADSWVRSGSSVNSNKGSSTVLYADKLDSGSAERRIFLKLSVDTTESIDSAQLRMRCARSSDRGGDLRTVSNNSWGEMTITWANQPAVGSIVASAGAVTAGNWVDFDVSSVVTGPGTYSFALTTPSTQEVHYWSRESADAPRLVLDTSSAPPPTSDAGTATDAGTTTDSGTDSGSTTDAALPPVGDDYLLMQKSALMALPTTGAAWTSLKSIADGSLGAPDLKNQDNKHCVKTLAVALVYARTGIASYREKAKTAILSSIGTEQVGANNSILSLGRQLGAYVMAADFIDLDGADDTQFRTWLAPLRTKELGGHGRWKQLNATHADSANNWGAFAGASRIAASRYLGDTADVAAAAKVLAGFLGDRSAHAAFQPNNAEGTSWTCNPSLFTPINPACTLSGIDVDGAIVRDISRGGSLGWPPGNEGISYTHEALQGLLVQAELLQRAGYTPYSWSNQALRRAAGLLTRANGWNFSSVNYHLPWLLNARYGLGLPTKPAGYGRVFGYTDWLYGS